MLDSKIQRLINNFKLRNIEAFYVESFEEVNERLLQMIPEDCTVGIGHSMTLQNSEVVEKLIERGNIVLDKTRAKSKEESKEIKKKALTADWYITGTNAVSFEGHIVNIDHSGNRVAAMIYGPDKVAIVVGVNKLADSLEAAIERARNVASPLNAKRAGFNPPCVELKRCVDCKSKERVCFNLVVIEGQEDPDRIKVFLVNESAGF
jgi:L-lactate utilization protein LutB